MLEARRFANVKIDANMIDDTFHITSSGVRIYADFKDNLIIDQDDPIFGDMRVEKINDLASETAKMR